MGNPKEILSKAISKTKVPYRHFDPEGDGYDYQSAIEAGIGPDKKTKHWASRNPKTGQLLKGRKHKTWGLLEKGEKEAGYSISKGKDGRYYSKKKGK